ncbi:hypothetical protein NKR23_g5013 [Pleurostoma richardsiae]|uniref:Uncharacterized protein n=1 Tax=Pleurostoma richardsiae TaxID=41990 RepID=A0AA38VUR4_9PEZI|nr:hypothetical protein NKR23_g5013 [Pleurostoma richardsiae]
MSTSGGPASQGAVIGPGNLSYENGSVNLDEITIRQLTEDIGAYRYDLEFCKNEMATSSLTPQEMRTLQLRILDLGHQIRHCQHRIELLQAQTQMRKQSSSSGNGIPTQISAVGPFMAKRTGGKTPLTPMPPKRSAEDANGIPAPSLKKTKRDNSSASPEFDENIATETNMSLQRLGFWKCRLCTAPKYILAGEGRLPSAPCKWPLKDISKMITHFMEMHTEHEPAERCVELGSALEKNRGPFEYWLRRSRSQNIADYSVIDDAISELLGGHLPVLLRKLSRAAAGFPSS